MSKRLPAAAPRASPPAAGVPRDDKRKDRERVRDMAALLFAELFYRQVMTERAEKRRKEDKNKKIDGEPSKGLQ
jgi:hypothetical protein